MINCNEVVESDQQASLKCKNCDVELPPTRPQKKWCSIRCKAAFKKANGSQLENGGHVCRECKTWFPITKDQGNKWLCSDECRKARNARIVREFHTRHPHSEAVYRARSRVKRKPDCSLTRFYSWNPHAPRSCEACGESRVLDVAHKPEHARNGRRKQRSNCLWPEMVWVLCPNCHALLDRMNYAPVELGLS